MLVVTVYFVTVIGVLGLAVGSFLNVVIHRVPLGESIVRPRSQCPGCGTTILSRDNVPVFSWLLLCGQVPHVSGADRGAVSAGRGSARPIAFRRRRSGDGDRGAGACRPFSPSRPHSSPFRRSTSSIVGSRRRSSTPSSSASPCGSSSSRWRPGSTTRCSRQRSVWSSVACPCGWPTGSRRRAWASATSDWRP